MMMITIISLKFRYNDNL